MIEYMAKKGCGSGWWPRPLHLLPSTFMEAPDCRMLCSRTEHCGQGTHQGVRQPAAVCLGRSFLTEVSRLRPAPSLSRSSGRPANTVRQSLSFYSILGKVILAVSHTLRFFCCPTLWGLGMNIHSLLLRSVPLYWDLGRQVSSRCWGSNSLQWLPTYTSSLRLLSLVCRKLAFYFLKFAGVIFFFPIHIRPVINSLTKASSGRGIHFSGIFTQIS